MTAEQRQEYAQTIWQAYCAKYGIAEWRMSSNDWNVILGWMDRGLPLRYVLQGIADAGTRGRTLSYCVPAVDDETARVIRAQVL
jgi:hypothetical protein